MPSPSSLFHMAERRLPVAIAGVDVQNAITERVTHTQSLLQLRLPTISVEKLSAYGGRRTDPQSDPGRCGGCVVGGLGDPCGMQPRSGVAHHRQSVACGRVVAAFAKGWGRAGCVYPWPKSVPCSALREIANAVFAKRLCSQARPGSSNTTRVLDGGSALVSEGILATVGRVARDSVSSGVHIRLRDRALGSNVVTASCRMWRILWTAEALRRSPAVASAHRHVQVGACLGASGPRGHLACTSRGSGCASTRSVSRVRPHGLPCSAQRRSGGSRRLSVHVSL